MKYKIKVDEIQNLIWWNTKYQNKETQKERKNYSQETQAGDISERYKIQNIIWWNTKYNFIKYKIQFDEIQNNKTKKKVTVRRHKLATFLKN